MTLNITDPQDTHEKVSQIFSLDLGRFNMLSSAQCGLSMDMALLDMRTSIINPFTGQDVIVIRR